MKLNMWKSKFIKPAVGII